MIDDAEYGLIVSFPDQSQSFTLGFEAGMIWQRIQSGEVSLEATTRVENRQVLERMAFASGLSCSLESSGIEGWDNLKMSPKKTSLYLIQGGLSAKRAAQAKEGAE